MGVEAAAGETPRLTGVFVGETHRVLKHTQTVHLIGWLSVHCLVVFFLELWFVLSFGSFFGGGRGCLGVPIT